MTLLKKTVPLHPFLFATYPVLFLYAQNVDFTPLTDVLTPLAIVAAFVAILLLVLFAMLRDGARAGLLVSLFALLFFSYGRIVDLLEAFEVPMGGFIIGPHALLLPVWVVCFALGVYFVFKTRRDLRTITNLLNVMAAVLVLLSLGGIVSYHLGKVGWGSNAGEESLAVTPDTVAPGEDLPDIYYIILDAYASQEILQETWNYDNSEFVSYLRDSGFYVVPDAHSNYALTFLSLASSLNMEYLDYLTETLSVDSADATIPNQKIQDSEVVRFLKARGYKFVHFQTGWGPTARNPNADRDIKCGNVNEFTEVLVRTTLLRSLADRFISHDRREVVLCTFSTLAEVQHTTKGPRFVFAHILVPHPPFLFGPNGEAINTDPALRTKDWSKYYLGQLEFVNQQVEHLVERLLSEAETPPMIILQADHGSKLIRQEGDPSREMLKERLGILNAYLLPDGGERFVHDGITPVNTFRVLFLAYFGADFEPVEDRSYFSRLNRPYDFLDGTDTLAGQ
ncbi:MAG TPA: sulfatase-like hydrolase/transferase [Anaerolineae bacterium]|nr:sulfatase-like hydrolase/transferase [Anaerolineae bacterium]